MICPIEALLYPDRGGERPGFARCRTGVSGGLAGVLKTAVD